MRTKITAILAIAFLLFSSVSGLFAIPANYVYMNGTGYSYVIPEGSNNPPKSSAQVPFEEQMNDAYAMFADLAGGEVVVGHSQGGMRGVAYARKMDENGKASNLKAVISVAGPVQGYTPLAQGSKVLESNMQTMSNKIIRGAGAILGIASIVFPVVEINGQRYPTIAFAFLYQFAPNKSLSETLKILEINTDSKIMHDVLAFLDDGQIAGEGRFCSAEVLRDFNPQSDYVNRYLAGSKKVPLVVKVPVGTTWVQTSPTTGKYVVIYKLFTFFNAMLFRIETYKPIPDTVAVGYIYGTDRDPINMANSAGAFSASDANNFIKLYSASAGVAMFLHTGIAAGFFATAAAFWYIPFVSIPAAILGGLSVKSAVDAETAANLSSDFPGSWNRDILGTNSSDAFIPVEAATRNINQSGGMTMIPDRMDPNNIKVGTYIKSVPDNHDSELKDPAIWGPGGSPSNPTRGGLIQIWLSGRDNWNDSFSHHGM